MREIEKVVQEFLEGVSVVPCSEIDSIRAEVLGDVWADIYPKLVPHLSSLLLSERDAARREAVEECAKIAEIEASNQARLCDYERRHLLSEGTIVCMTDYCKNCLLLVSAKIRTLLPPANETKEVDHG